MSDKVIVARSLEQFAILLRCAGLGAFWVIFMWGFWTSGIYALGINTTIFLGAVAWLLYASDDNVRQLMRCGKSWIIPLTLMTLSYALFENPFIKLVTIVVLPISWSLFYSAAALSRDKTFVWTPLFIAVSILSTLHFPRCFIHSVSDYFLLLRSRLHFKFTHRTVLQRILQGICLFLALALLVVVPLLVSADALFGSRLLDVANLVAEVIQVIFECSLVARLLCLLGVSCAVLALVKLSRVLSDVVSNANLPVIDSIVSGIVISGMLIIYSLFIWVQFERLWYTELPTQFAAAENVVKGGFWQLVAISLINILLFTWCYRRTSQSVQGILAGFTVACLVLVLSAANRMWLYVTTYGLSYEKFYAAYTVLFCIVVFITLLASLAGREAKDNVKSTCFTFLWMYGIVCVLPVEAFVLSTNIKLSTREDSRIDLVDMTMLSADVLGQAESARALLTEQAGPSRSLFWRLWYARQNQHLATRRWFELNLSNLWNGWGERSYEIEERAPGER